MSHTQTEPKIAREVAVEELERFFEAMDLQAKVDESRLDPDDLKSLRSAKDAVIEAIMCGALEVDAEGQPVYTPKKGGKPITFREPNGADILAMDKCKQGATISKQNAVLGSLTGEGPARFASMAQRDYSVCTALVALFLA